MVKFFDCESKLVSADIEKVEIMVGFKFPSTYRKHLLQYNGGRCEPNVFSFVERETRTLSQVDWFLAIYKGKSDNLVTYLQIYKLDQKRLPSRMIPIAHDPGGNLICLSCLGHDEGMIYFWNHECEVDYLVANDDDYSNLYRIADCLEDFLASLQS